MPPGPLRGSKALNEKSRYKEPDDTTELAASGVRLDPRLGESVGRSFLSAGNDFTSAAQVRPLAWQARTDAVWARSCVSSCGLAELRSMPTSRMTCTTSG
jgi:hypothetical protein